METPDFFIARLKKAIEFPDDKRVFVMKREDRLRIEVTQGQQVIEDVEFPFQNETWDEYEISPQELKKRFEGPEPKGGVKDFFRNV
jgi:hypothetical protein